MPPEVQNAIWNFVALFITAAGAVLLSYLTIFRKMIKASGEAKIQERKTADGERAAALRDREILQKSYDDMRDQLDRMQKRETERTDTVDLLKQVVGQMGEIKIGYATSATQQQAQIDRLADLISHPEHHFDVVQEQYTRTTERIAAKESALVQAAIADVMTKIQTLLLITEPFNAIVDSLKGILTQPQAVEMTNRLETLRIAMLAMQSEVASNARTLLDAVRAVPGETSQILLPSISVAIDVNKTPPEGTSIVSPIGKPPPALAQQISASAAVIESKRVEIKDKEP